jgi:hypothetical protein
LWEPFVRGRATSTKAGKFVSCSEGIYMSKNLLIIFILSSSGVSAQDNVDTLKISGTCEYIGRTYSIIATTYFRFKVHEVLHGEFHDDHITFEASINSRQHLLLEKITVDETVQSATNGMFSFFSVPVREIRQCHSDRITVILQKWDDDHDPILFSYVPEE